MVQLVSSGDNAVTMLQHEFQPLTARLSQARLSLLDAVLLQEATLWPRTRASFSVPLFVIFFL